MCRQHCAPPSPRFHPKEASLWLLAADRELRQGLRWSQGYHGISAGKHIKSHGKWWFNWILWDYCGIVWLNGIPCGKHVNVKFTLIIHVVLLDLVCTGIIRRPMPPPFVSTGTNSGPLERSNFMTSRSSDAMDASSTCRWKQRFALHLKPCSTEQPFTRVNSYWKLP